MRFNNLNDWLTWQESLNPKEIDLGLDRISCVLQQANLKNTFHCPLITVGGTNGKGSVVAILEAIAKDAGLKVCSYTSPHIFQYNERIKIDGWPVDDQALCESFERIDQARGDISLTYFEFGTLAAIDLFFAAQPDLVILEVGLGGRLDAVNIMDADVCVLTSIAIDHVDWLGDNRESIGFEKAGIFRSGVAVVCGDSEPPQSVLGEAKKQHCELLLAGRDYDVTAGDNWTLKSCYGEMKELPAPNLCGEFQKVNAATAIVAMQLLQLKGLLSADMLLPEVVASALVKINLAGRYQCINNQPQVFVDVAHNPHAAKALSSQLKLDQNTSHKTWAIVAMLADKDISGVLQNVSADIDCWCFAGLENITRGLPVEDLYEQIPDDVMASVKPVLSGENRHDLALNQCTMLSEMIHLAESVEQACAVVLAKMKPDDRIIIFGSFHTVANAMQYFSVLNNNEHV